MEYGLPRATDLLEQIDFGNTWLRWCDHRRDWPAETTTVFEQDWLGGDWGGSYSPLHVQEFIEAYRNTGAIVTQVRRTRSFEVDVTVGDTRMNVFIQLGKGINTEECSLTVHQGETPVGVEALHSIARTILMRQTGIDPFYPRPNISSRSHLEVTSRELVATMGWLAEKF